MGPGYPDKIQISRITADALVRGWVNIFYKWLERQNIDPVPFSQDWPRKELYKIFREMVEEDYDVE